MAGDRGTIKELADAVDVSVRRRISKTETILAGIRIVLVLFGGALVGLAELVIVPTTTGIPWRETVGTIGVAMVFIGGLLLLWVDSGQTEDLKKARDAVQAASDYLTERDTLLARLREARELDERRRRLIVVQKVMLEIAEQMHSRHNGSSKKEAIETLLHSVQLSLLAAMGILAGERYNLSVFRIEGEYLVRLVNICADRNDEKAVSRQWMKGEGYSGAAWNRGGEVIVSDSSDRAVQEAFYVRRDNAANLEVPDAQKYRSVVSLPLKVGGQNVTWGVLTVTSDRTGRFVTDPSDVRSQSVEAVRAVSKVLELLASYNHLCD